MVSESTQYWFSGRRTKGLPMLQTSGVLGGLTTIILATGSATGIATRRKGGEYKTEVLGEDCDNEGD